MMATAVMVAGGVTRAMLTLASLPFVRGRDGEGSSLKLLLSPRMQLGLMLGLEPSQGRGW